MLQRYRFVLEAVAIIVVTGIVGVIIAFYGPRLQRPEAETRTAVVINEVYPALMAADPAPEQWVELYNRTGDWQKLENWSLETVAGNYMLLPTIELPPDGYAIIAASLDWFQSTHPGYLGVVVSPAAWSGIDLANGFVVLRNQNGDPVDFVNWGDPTLLAAQPAGVKLWDKPSIPPGAGWIFKDGNLQVDHSLERRPVGMDRDVPADWFRQPFLSPGTVYPPSATGSEQALFIDWTNVASFAGGILLWIAFVYVALIARRFQALTRQRTFWQAMLIAPSGILFYNIVQGYGFLVRGQMSDPEKWWGFVVLFVSAVLCTVLVFIFLQRAKSILEG
jgi:hypothetical protein